MNNYFDRHARDLDSVRLLVTPGYTKLLSYWLLGIFILFVLVSFLPWTQNINSTGLVTSFFPSERPQAIETIIAGRIEKWYIREGQQVKKGDTILLLSEVKDKYFDPNLLKRTGEQINSKESALSSTKDKSNSLQKQIGALQEVLRLNKGRYENKIKQTALKVQSDSIDFIASKNDFEIAKVRLKRDEDLKEKGLKSEVELESRRLKLQETVAKLLSAENKWEISKNDWINAIIERNAIESEYMDKIAKAESEFNATLTYYYNSEADISKMVNELSNLQIRNSLYAVLAPQDGFIIKTIKSGLGETVKEGEQLASIMPLNIHKAVELYVKPMDVPLITLGSKVRLQFDGWPSLVFSGWPDMSFGTFGGTIAVIDKLDTQGKYRVLVIPDEADHPWPPAVQLGSGVYGWAMLSDVPIYYELWRQQNGFPPDFVSGLKKNNSDEAYDMQKEKKE
jgi:multidrug efflux pump subunit AcrA (membrane-fusion protein)